MNSIFATLLAACLAGASASAQAPPDPTKKDEAPTLQKEPAGVVCAKADRTRHTEKKPDRKPETGMPFKGDGGACPDTSFAPKKPMA